MKKITQILSTAAFLSFIHLGHSQISISGDLPQSYTQNFDSFGTNSVNWTNNSTLTGWFYQISTNGGGNIEAFQLFATDGSVTPTAFTYNFGSANSSDRAMGSISGLFAGVVVLEHFYGAQFINNSSEAVNQVSISYAGEQWEDNTLFPHTLQFLYRVGGTDFIADVSNVGWTSQDALDFTTLQNFGSGALDGNNPANRVVLTSSIGGLNIPPGESFWIRWSDLDDLFTTNQGVGIDDVSVTFNKPALSGVTIELKRPKVGKKLKFKGQKGFKVKGFIFSESNTVTKASYAAFGGTNSPTNLTFIDAGKFKAAKGKLAKKKNVKNIFQSTKTTKAGVGIASGASPVTLLVKITGGAHNNEVIFTNVFTDVKVK